MEVPNSKKGVSVRAYKGDAMTLLAFDLDESKTENFAGFSIRITPGPKRPYYLTNLLTYPPAIRKKNNIKAADAHRSALFAYPEVSMGARARNISST